MSLALAPHPYALTIEDALRIAESTRDKQGTALLGVERMAKAIDDLPPHLRADALLGASDVVDLPAYVDRLLTTCEELGWLLAHRHHLDLTWYTARRLSNGSLTLGTAKAISAKERALHPAGPEGAPWWRVELSLAYWLLAEDHERHRLLHHELTHLEIRCSADGQEDRPGTRPHDVEEFISTAGRFGPLTSQQASLATVTRAHPQWWPEVDGQCLLFAPWNGEAARTREFMDAVKDQGVTEVTISGGGKSVTLR